MTDMQRVRIRNEGPLVQVLINERLALEVPWNVADDIFRQGFAATRKAEEIANAEGIVFDAALLIRAGAPFGLSNNSDILREAVKEAGHDPLLRRHMPGGIKSQEIVGTPEVRHAR